MATFPLFRDTNVAAVTSGENSVATQVCFPSKLFILNYPSFFLLFKAFDKDLSTYGSVLYSIVYTDSPGIFSLARLTGDVILFNSSLLVSGNLTSTYTLEISAADNLGLVPFNKAEQNASVYVSIYTASLFLKENETLLRESQLTGHVAALNSGASEINPASDFSEPV